MPAKAVTGAGKAATATRGGGGGATTIEDVVMTIAQGEVAETIPADVAAAAADRTAAATRGATETTVGTGTGRTGVAGSAAARATTAASGKDGTETGPLDEATDLPNAETAPLDEVTGPGRREGTTETTETTEIGATETKTTDAPGIWARNKRATRNRRRMTGTADT